MENLTHSLLGAAVAELTVPANATTTQRRSFLVAGLVAANLPDADLVYTGITAGPLGYLLHHRGHTHTVVGLLGLAVLIGAMCLLPPIRRRLGPLRPRLWTLIGLGLLSHLLLDSWNSYGVHPFWPLDAAWYYGDAIYILEPWLWLFFGVAATLNARPVHARMMLGTLLVALAGALAGFGMIPVGALIALVALAGSLGVLAAGWAPITRSAAAIAAAALFVTGMFVLRQHVRQKVLAETPAATRGRIIDVVLSPQPANPLCWSALAIATDEQSGEYVMTRGTVAAVGSSGCGANRSANVTWAEPVRQSLHRLRDLVRRDCAVRAWMQFGRAPELGDAAISDLRFGGTARDNFSAMPLSPAADASTCPSNLTRWGMPREDLIRVTPPS